MDAIKVLSEALQWSHSVLDTTIEGTNPEQLHWVPVGVGHPIGALYVHAVIAEDILVNVMLKGGAPLHGTTFAGKTGASDPQFMQSLEWSRALKVDLPVFRAFAKAVAEASVAYVTGLSEADLDATRDFTQFNMGTPSIGWTLNALVIGHNHNLAGEISATKGAQGLKGYPF